MGCVTWKQNVVPEHGTWHLDVGNGSPTWHGILWHRAWYLDKECNTKAQDSRAAEERKPYELWGFHGLLGMCSKAHVHPLKAATSPAQSHPWDPPWHPWP